MTEYIYFVKCPNCEDEHFDFFDVAKEFALGCLSKKPIITQTEVCRNDFGECTDSCDLGTVWSWEDVMNDTKGGYTDAEPTKSSFTKDDLKFMTDDQDPEFDNLNNSIDFELTDVPDNFKKPITKSYATKEFETPNFDAETVDEFEDESIKGYRVHESTDKKSTIEGMTIKQLVEVMEEAEDEVECSLCNELTSKADCFYDEDEGYICPTCKEETVKCTWCGSYFDPSVCRKEVDLGWLCSRCEMAIKSRGETLTFKEGNYWDFLDEDINNAESFTLTDLVKDSIDHLVSDIGRDSSAEGFVDDVITDIENNFNIEVPKEPKKYRDWASAIACEVSRQLNSQPQLDEKLVNIDFSQIIDSSDMEIWGVEPIGENTYKAFLMKRFENVPFRGDGSEIEKVESEMFDIGGLFVFHFGKDGLPKLGRWDPELLNSLGSCEIIFDDERYDRACNDVFNRPSSKLEELEEAVDYRKHLVFCPECGTESAFDTETGICLDCGFNIQ